MKKLILASVLVVVAALFTACGGAGSPGGSGDDDERMGTLKTTTNSQWATFNFELFSESDVTNTLEADSNGYYRYTIPAGSWKSTKITHEFNRVYKEYYEFTSPDDDTATYCTESKYVHVTIRTLTDEEIADIEDMHPLQFNLEYVDSLATSFDYYLDGHTFVTISEYIGDDIWRRDIYKTNYARDITKTNSENTKILDKEDDDSVKFYFLKQK
ncbi:MAG: hypothetical protein J6S91_03585 [Treponema sp.]|nr:hypothetical protein [Treponema sp.]